MSEYIEIETELGDAGELYFHTNLRLTAAGDEEYYDSPAAMEVGSPVAQALAAVAGIATLEMSDGEMTATLYPDADWHAVVADVNAALKDFFL